MAVGCKELHDGVMEEFDICQKAKRLESSIVTVCTHLAASDAIMVALP